ncbi:hypothetical protein GGF31_004414 [Allomyces arbusculus]|nr:hypothetical protein GGF31_004414 [Allomyces arbusculus]
MVSGHSTFVQKMYSILENDELKEIVSWSASGDSFLVHSPGEFARSVLPRYFKHSNFSSYNRQLNMWGFSKISNLSSSPVSPVGSSTSNSRKGMTEFIEPAWEFRHPFFQRGQVHLLVQIKRKSPKPARSPSPVTDDAVVTQLEARVADLESKIADMHSAADQNRAALKRMAQWVLAAGAAAPTAVVEEARAILRDICDPRIAGAARGWYRGSPNGDTNRAVATNFADTATCLDNGSKHGAGDYIDVPLYHERVAGSSSAELQPQLPGARTNRDVAPAATNSDASAFHHQRTEAGNCLVSGRCVAGICAVRRRV